MRKYIVAPYSFHFDLLKQFQQIDVFNDVKLIDRQQLFDAYFLKFKDDAIKLIMCKFNISYEFALTLLNFIPYIKYDDKNHAKFHFLFQIKQFLKENNLIIQDDTFLNFIKNKDVEVYGYSKKDKTLNEIFKSVNANTIYKDETIYHEDTLNIFETSEDEVRYLFISIYDLINHGIDINDIYVYGCNDETYDLINRFNKYYQIPFNGLKTTSLIKFDFAKKFFKHFENGYSIDEIFLNLDQEFLNDENYNQFKEKVFLLVDEMLSKSQQLDIFKHCLDVNIHDDIYDKGVNILHSLTSLKNKHIFILNFTQNDILKLHSDSDYLLDIDKEKINMMTSNDLNEINKDVLLHFLNSDNKFYYSYSKKSFSNNNYISFLKDDLKLKENHIEIIEYDYNKDSSRFDLIKIKDLYAKYKIVSPYKESMEQHLDIAYKTYDNQFKPFHIYDDNTYLKHSYSSLNTYINCPFSYYLQRVLKIDPFKDTFNTKLGNIFHKVLELGLKDFTLSFDECLNLACKDYQLEVKEQIFFEEAIQNLKVAFEASKNQLKQIKNPKWYLEESLTVKMDKHTDFYGKIDKIILVDDTYLMLIDYKTGNDKFEKNKVSSEESLQLPTYAYLIKNHPDFRRFKIGGLYINNLITNDIKHRIDDINNLTTLKLKGVSLKDLNYCLAIEPNYLDKDVKYINSIKPTKDSDFSAYGFIEENDITNYIDICKDIYDKANKDIRSNKFFIAPKKTSFKDAGACEHCNYADICFKKDNQFRMVKKTEEVEEDELE